MRQAENADAPATGARIGPRVGVTTIGSKRAPLRAATAIAAMLTFAGSAGAAPMNPIPGGPVRIQSGLVAGTLLKSGVRTYLGVPYAKPPTGELRWQRPQPIRWEGIWNADRKGPECIQVLRAHDLNHYFGEEPSSEDCLYLNLWTPPTAKPGSKLPVVVFLYGGGGTIGSSGMANYDGENVARRGAIFVNLNYRIGALGFMAHPELSREQGGHSGDYGYMDQAAALRWIHDNIARFGGDADKVVITGQSFGAGSVAAQLFSPLAKGLFRGAMMSSACNYTGEDAALAEGEKVGLELQKRLGAADLKAMRNVPADRILAQQAESQVGVNNPGVRTPAVIDGYFFTGTKAQTLAAHRMNDVPIIASSNGDDIDSNMSPLTRAHTVAEYQAAARQMYGTEADAFLKLYPTATDAEVQPTAHRAAIENGFLAAGRTCAELQARYNRSAAYIDLFSRKHPYTPGVVIFDQDVATVGAYHTADVPYWFDTLDKYNMFRSTRTWQAWDRTLTDRMARALIALARTGAPKTPGLDMPAWTAANPQYVVFGDTAEARKMDIAKMDWLAQHRPARSRGVVNLPAGPRD
jgi:para-nitrobenzyl esterase